MPSDALARLARVRAELDALVAELDATVAEAEAEPADDRGRLLVTVVEAAERLSIGRTTLLKLVADGELATVTIGRRRLVPVAELAAYVERQLALDRHPRSE